MISDKDVCKHCHRVVGEVPKYHCPKSPTGMHEPVDPPAPPINHATGTRSAPPPAIIETIDITPVGCQTPEGAVRVNAAMKAFEDVTAQVANAATQFFDDWRITIMQMAQNQHPDLREDLHQLDALIGARGRKQEAFLRAVAGAPEAAAEAKVITFDALVAEYGEYTKDGVQYAIEQNPYPDYVAGSSTAYVVSGETYYFASGYDREGNPVRLIWEITNKETEDESDACDWDVFEVQPNYGDPAPWHTNLTPK